MVISNKNNFELYTHVNTFALYIPNYYKSLFGAPEEGNFFMDESRADDIS
jgi:hypothetical protein